MNYRSHHLIIYYVGVKDDDYNWWIWLPQTHKLQYLYTISHQMTRRRIDFTPIRDG